ncbi:hypothetical protein Goe9_c01890 [Bacillus phage vB_BsuM-Goe9]|nr:hypothetical protein Goe9_c01890 [Bacillus phage vB_BsuM-Goe9]
MKTKMNFGEALEVLKQGMQVYRSGWNGKNMFLFLKSSDALASDFGFGFGEYINEPVFGDIIFIKTADNKIHAWVPSQTDILVEDWDIVS